MKSVTFNVTDVVCVMPLLVPVMVAVNVPGAAVWLAVKVSVRVPVALTEAGLNAAVTPDGCPEALRLTVPVKPLMPVTVTVVLPEPPGARVTVAGLTDSEKSVTVKVSDAVRTRLPQVPVMVRGYVPGGVLPPTLNVAVLLPEPDTEDGENKTLVPLGRPDAERLTVPLKL